MTYQQLGIQARLVITWLSVDTHQRGSLLYFMFCLILFCLVLFYFILFILFCYVLFYFIILFACQSAAEPRAPLLGSQWPPVDVLANARDPEAGSLLFTPYSAYLASLSYVDPGGKKKKLFKMLENKPRPTRELVSERALCSSYNGSISPHFQDCAIAPQDSLQRNWKSGSQTLR